MRPSQKDSHGRWEPWAGLHSTPLGDFFFEINIEKRASHPHPHPRPWLSAAGWLRGAGLVLRGVECWAQADSPDPLRQRHEAPTCWGGGEEEGGVGGPATAGKRWPHFFQMGKLRHKEVFFVCLFVFWDLAQVTHSESAFGEGIAHTPGNKVTQASVPPMGRQGRAEGPRRPGGGHSAALRGWGAGRSGEGLCLALGRAKSSAGERGGGILVRTGFSGKTGIHFKISAQKGSGAVLKPGGTPGPYRSPLGALQPPRKDAGDPGGLLGEIPFVTKQGQQGRCSCSSLNTEGCRPCSQLAEGTPSHPGQRHLGTTVRGRGGNQG